MSKFREKKLAAELKRLTNKEFKINTIDDNISEWIVKIEGPPDTPYSNLTFDVKIIFSSKYPISAPAMYFVKKMFHPNVSNEGKVCASFLGNDWSPTLGASGAIYSLISLLNDPNNNDPYNSNAAKLWDNKKEYRKEVLKRYNSDLSENEKISDNESNYYTDSDNYTDSDSDY